MAPDDTAPWIPPTSVVRTALAVRTRLRQVADLMLPPQGLAAERTFQLAEIKMLGVVCELGVPEALGTAALTAPEIAARVGAAPDPTERVMRFLASRGWFRRRRNGSYRLNAWSRSLRADAPQSLRDWVGFMAADWHWTIWNSAGTTMRSGEPAVRAATGRPFFDWVHDERPDAGELFDGAMRSLSGVAGPLVAGAVDLDGVRSVCDVGGGNGGVVRSLLERDPDLSGVVFDLPEVVRGVPAVMEGIDPSRWEAAGGDFFEPSDIPPGHDRYLMQAIMHDWGDDAAGRILDNVRRAMGPGSRVWVVDSILEPAERDDLTKAVDMLMLVLTEGGRERTLAEWERLFSAHGLRIESKVQLPLLIWVFTLAVA